MGENDEVLRGSYPSEGPMSAEVSLSVSGQVDENREGVMPELGLELPDLPESVWLRVIANALDPDAPPVADDIVPDTLSESIPSDADHFDEFIVDDANPADDFIGDGDDDGGGPDDGLGHHGHDSPSDPGAGDDLSHPDVAHFNHADFSHDDFTQPGFSDPDLPGGHDAADPGWSS